MTVSSNNSAGRTRARTDRAFTVLLDMKSMVAAKIGGWESLSRGVPTGHP